jgi:ATP-dependent Clp protease ATP-binding subunit ClpA
LLLTRRARNCLESACLAAAAGKEEATAPWLLMAILKDTRALPTRMLASAGFEVDDLARKARLLSRRWVEHGGLRARIENPELASQTGLLDSLGRDLTEDARQGRLHHVIGRERELIELMAILMEEGRTSPILLGDAGVGKTAIVEGLALLIAEGKVHPDLLSKEIHTVEVGSIVAGTGIVGKLQEKVQALVKAVERDPDLIVFIDEIHMLVGAGTTNAAPDMDVANILKPALSGGRLQCIGSTTLAEYRTSIEADPALARRFGPIQVGEPTPEDALEILTTLRPRYEAFHRLQIEDAALRAAVDLSVRYVLDRRLPAKALDVLNRSCSDKRLRTWLGEFGDLGSLSREEHAALLEHAGRAAATAPAVLTADDVAAWSPAGPASLWAAFKRERRRVCSSSRSFSANASGVRTRPLPSWPKRSAPREQAWATRRSRSARSCAWDRPGSARRLWPRSWPRSSSTAQTRWSASTCRSIGTSTMRGN